MLSDRVTPATDCEWIEFQFNSKIKYFFSRALTGRQGVGAKISENRERRNQRYSLNKIGKYR